MRHSNIVSKYEKAVRLYEKGKLRRAKWLFSSIVIEIISSDTDSMGDIHLSNSAQSYIDEIEKIKGSKRF